ncbi:hypothetical protein DENSPDRAFT_558591 [Dentipellis sp. KUC8613]|nr:hypothetical protein DENSPDRAFT_558591 [Dentipellis sp. KUC8613]
MRMRGLACHRGRAHTFKSTPGNTTTFHDSRALDNCAALSKHPACLGRNAPCTVSSACSCGVYTTSLQYSPHLRSLELSWIKV